MHNHRNLRSASACALAVGGLLLAGCGAGPRLTPPVRAAAPGLAKPHKATSEQALMEAAVRRGNQRLFSAIDVNADARLLRDEWDRRCLNLDWWQSIDTNTDGAVVFAEFSTDAEVVQTAHSLLEQIADMFAENDLDGDGQLSGHDFDGDGAVMKYFDKDGDGIVTLPEFNRFWAQLVGGEIGSIAWPECPASSGRAGVPTFVAPGGLRLSWRR